jgi:hypothetical protein
MMRSVVGYNSEVPPRRTTPGRPERLSALRRRLILSNLLVFLLPTVGATAALVILASIVNPGLLFLICS